LFSSELYDQLVMRAN